MRINCIYDCDEWKSRSSMRLIALADGNHLEDVLSKIKEEHGYDDEDMETYIHIEDLELNNY